MGYRYGRLKYAARFCVERYVLFSVYSRGDCFLGVRQIGSGYIRTGGSCSPGSSVYLLRRRWVLWGWPGFLFLEGLASPDEGVYFLHCSEYRCEHVVWGPFVD